jgi:uncharacterized damage-inducible protein DinB
MTDVVQTLHGIPEGYASPLVARIAWQMDEQRHLVLAAVHGMTAADLAWQPAPGMNSIGMLLAHLAVAENHMVAIGVEGKSASDTKGVVGLTDEDDGLPLAPGAPPPPALEGKDLYFFEDALARARAYTRGVLPRVTDADLARVIVRQRADGFRREFDVAWMLYHLLEHEAGHRGQIQVLRHLMKATRGEDA